MGAVDSAAFRAVCDAMFLSSSASPADRLPGAAGAPGKAAQDAQGQSIFSFYVLKRQSVIFACKWIAPSRVYELGDQGSKSRFSLDVNEEHKLLSGLLFSVKAFCQKINPTVSGSTSALVDDAVAFHSFATPVYKVHYFESVTGCKLVMITSPALPDMNDSLKQIYTEVYVPKVLRCPAALGNPKMAAALFGPILEEYLSTKHPTLLASNEGKLVMCPVMV